MSTDTEKMQKQWAREVKKRAYTVKNACSKNAGKYRPIITVDYKADELMSEIISELIKITEIKDIVAIMADETVGKGAHKNENRKM